TATYNIRNQIVQDTNGTLYGVITTTITDTPHVAYDGNTVIEQTIDNVTLNNAHNNYSLTNTAFNIKIVPKVLTVTANDIFADIGSIDKQYDKTDTATADFEMATGVGTEIVQLHVDGVYSGVNAGSTIVAPMDLSFKVANGDYVLANNQVEN
ncbi:MAG TPA: hypothetical protein PLR86_12175, partial [Planctomycetota bacterium]|nr:hypothetical protein [Planctomycetota bacterium]